MEILNIINPQDRIIPESFYSLVSIIHLVLCQLLCKVKSLYFYYKSPRKKLKLHAQGQTKTHRMFTETLSWENPASACLYSPQSLNFLSSDHQPPTALQPYHQFHQCIQPLPAGCWSDSPLTLIVGDTAGADRQMKTQMREVLSSRKGTRMESQWEQVLQLPKQPTILRQSSMCWHVLVWALVSLLQ